MAGVARQSARTTCWRTRRRSPGLSDLAHLRVFTGRSRAAMARELGMAEETYPQMETTGLRGLLARARYDDREERWIAW
ncbi:hypothetical protein [Kitasatospora purpeofusca]|uniref:hypothetical protein n=1 Tax=Kitasatospora purpeofusca TaxID=67352 RepID=UPI003824B337